MALFKRIGDVLEEDQAQNHMLVFAGVHVAAHLVGRGPQFLLEAEGRAVGLGRGIAFCAGHKDSIVDSFVLSEVSHSHSSQRKIEYAQSAVEADRARLIHK